MKIRGAIILALTSIVLIACGGDVNVSPTNLDNSVDNSVVTNSSGGSNTDALCASYEL